MKCVVICFVVIISFSPAVGGPIDGLDYYSESMATSARITSGIYNPAGLGFWNDLGMRYDHQITDSSYKGNDAFMLSSRGIFLGVEWLRHTDNIYRRKHTFAIGDRIAPNFYAGFGYSWFGGSNDVYKSLKSWKLGLLYHPQPFISIAMVADRLNEPKFAGIRQKRLYQPGIAARPFGDKLTFSGDLRWLEGDDLSNLQGSIRAEVSPIEGFWLNCDYRTEGEWRLGVAFAFDQSRVGVQANLDRRQEYAGGSYFIEIGPTRITNAMFVRRRTGIIKLDGNITEEPRRKFPWGSKGRSMIDFITAIRKAADDDNIGNLIVKIDGIKLSFATAQELREAFKDFRKSGKKITVFMDNGSNLSYYLASAANEIYMNPSGILELTGIAATASFYKGTLDKLGIKAQVISTGKHKTFGDAFIDTTFSKEAREQLDWLLDDLYSQMVDGISVGRQMMSEKVRSLINDGPYENNRALELGLIDGLKHYDEIIEDQDRPFLSGMVELTRYYSRAVYNPRWSEPKKIAVIYANGSIIDGESGYSLIDGKTVGSNTLARTLRKVRKDKDIAGIVLRVNSPGGDAFASEEIYRELELLKGKKPLIISMGSVAASGGYYISCIGDKIFSSPATITGSIGVVVGKADISGFYEKIGLSHETIKRGRYSDIRSTTRAASDDEMGKISDMVWHFYEDFLFKVSTWRKMERDSVDAIGQGRVWTGSQAAKNGLIDSYGGIWDAIEHCRQKANIESEDRVVLNIYPRYGFSLPAGLSQIVITGEIDRFSDLARGSIFNFRMPFNIEIQ